VAEVVVVENWQPWRVVLVYHHWVCFNLVLESAHFKPGYAFYSRRCVRVRVTVSGGRSFSLSKCTTIPFCLVPLYIQTASDSLWTIWFSLKSWTAEFPLGIAGLFEPH
jgi:hypothetical protein